MLCCDTPGERSGASVLRVGIDVGGTFTDLFVYDDESGETLSAKVLTTPENQALGVMQSLEAGHVPLDRVSFIAHGTTTGTNALIERKGARTGLLTTEGFRDVLEIMRTDRPHGYDLSWDKPRPLVQRRFRRGIRERVDKDGNVEVDLADDHARSVIRELLARGVESIAVSFIHSYANPSHEQRVRELILEEDPQAHVSLSSDINAEYREYERTNTVVIDAYIKPIMVRYIQRLVADLKAGGLERRLFMMQGSGGMITADRAAQKPIATLSSGPAAGAIAAARVGAQEGLGDIVTFDVGGTSTDVSLVHGGRPFVTHQKHVEWGLPARVPVIDVESVGAGGGSIAWIDQGGALKVGPQSAGADPGPMCYGRGGTNPTLSDVLLLKGLLGHDLAGGRVHLDEETARRGVERLADSLGLSLDRVLNGIVEIAQANMANAVRSVSIWKGLDPRDLTLVAFGGAGGLVAGPVARALDIPKVVIPTYPGNTCAMGLLMTDMQEDATVAYLARASEIDLAVVNARLGELRERTLRTLVGQGVEDGGSIEFTYSADIRYHGQIYELSVPFDEFPVTGETLERTIERFEQVYENVYTIRLEGGTAEMTSLRVTAVGVIPKYQLGALAGEGAVELRASREVLEEDGRHPVDIRDRYLLPAGSTILGPAIVEEPGSTIWVASGMFAEVDAYGNVVIATNPDLERTEERELAKEMVD
jgi:N-methylhydantoinase A